MKLSVSLDKSVTAAAYMTWSLNKTEERQYHGDREKMRTNTHTQRLRKSSSQVHCRFSNTSLVTIAIALPREGQDCLTPSSRADPNTFQQTPSQSVSDNSDISQYLLFSFKQKPMSKE